MKSPAVVWPFFLRKFEKKTLKMGVYHDGVFLGFVSNFHPSNWSSMPCECVYVIARSILLWRSIMVCM